MGIYINMEMPENCLTDDCPCVNRENGFCQADPETRYVYGDRPHWCPLVPVPDHGRLGNLDELKERTTRRLYASNHGSMAEAYYSALIDLIDEAPTIIPAEEAEP